MLIDFCHTSLKSQMTPRLFVNFISHVTHLLSWDSGGTATNNPPHVRNMGVSHSRLNAVTR